MNALIYLQPLTPVLSAVMVALVADILLRMVPQARDRIWPLLGLPAMLAAGLQHRLNRMERARQTRQVRGMITVGIMLMAGLVLGGVALVAVRLNPSLEPVVWFLCLQVTFPWTAGVEIVKILQIKDKNDLRAAQDVLIRRHVPILVPSRNPDRHAVIRMLIEATATSLHRGLLSPLLWALVAKLAGLPPILVAVLVTTLLEAERVIVTQETLASPFVDGFKVIESVINFVPARVAALFWGLAAIFTPGAKPFTALRAMFVQSEAHRAVNSGWPVAAVSGALNIALPGGKKHDLWVGPKDATARAELYDLQKAMWLHGVALTLTGLVLTALLLLSIAG